MIPWVARGRDGPAARAVGGAVPIAICALAGVGVNRHLAHGAPGAFFCRMLRPFRWLSHGSSVASVLFVVCAGMASAQQSPRPRVRAVIVQRDAVFDSTEARYWPYKLANALHAETRPNVIRRELLMDVGDPFDSALVAESERNLRALGIFRDVRIDSEMTDSGVVLRVRTADAWTTTLGMSVATSGTQSVVDLSLREGNLLGTRTVAQLAYRNDPDRSSVLLGFDTPRAIGDRIGVGASVVDRSDGRAGTASLRLPFLSLSSRSGASLIASAFQGRVLQFRGSTIVDSLWREFAVLRAEGAVALSASPRGFTRLGLLAQVVRDDMVPLQERSLVPRTRSATAGPYLAVRRPRYIRAYNIERLERVEDIDLGAFATVTLLAAPQAWGYDRNGVGGSLGTGVGVPFPGGFARFGFHASALQTSEGTDSATIEGATTVVAQRGERHLVVLHGSAGRQRNAVPGREFDLGLGTGLRAYPAHAFTGDQYFVLAAEYRLLAWPRLFGLVGVGAAAFAGHAGAWDRGASVRTGTELGVGLRLASIREAGGIWRLDVSRRLEGAGFGGGWVASLGRGFVFGGI